MKKTLIKIGIIGTLLLLLVFSVFFQNTLTPEIRINEVSFQDNENNDWIELYNPSLVAKNLNGMYLTDNKEEKTKFKIEEDIAINPEGFLLIGGKNADKDSVALKTSFGIKNGETLYLIDANGIEVIDSLPLIIPDEQIAKAVGRFPDGSDEIFTFSEITTPGTFNQKDKPWIKP